MPLSLAGAVLHTLPSAPLWLGLLAASSIAGSELLVRQVAAPLARILQQAMRAAAGQADSMEQLDRVDDIGMLMRAVNQSGLNFRTFVDDVNSNLQALNAACRDIAQSNHTLSQCCEETEDNLQQTAASVEQLTATIKSNADATLQASHFTQDVNRAVNSGEEAVGQVSATMAAITQSSARITDIISVLDDLAFQTNMLALNAAVEAAHAGEQGRSFAVVAGEVSSLAQKSAASARDIAAIIDETLNTIRAGDVGGKAVQQFASTMDTMTQSSQAINDIINVLDNLAFQTNILALNAAVEAAHAGDQGRSFAVVAGEVRTLAQRSATAAKDIASIIDTTIDNISRSDKLVHHTSDSMGNILTQVQQVTQLMGQISLATQEQSIGLNQITDAVNNIDELTRQNKLLATHSSSAIDCLERQISTMADAVSVFSTVRR